MVSFNSEVSRANDRLGCPGLVGQIYCCLAVVIGGDSCSAVLPRCDLGLPIAEDLFGLRHGILVSDVADNDQRRRIRPVMRLEVFNEIVTVNFSHRGYRA